MSRRNILLGIAAMCVAMFGFVTNGFNIGGIMSPLLFGALMDRGEPRMVFWVIALSALAGILTVASLPRRRAA